MQADEIVLNIEVTHDRPFTNKLRVACHFEEDILFCTLDEKMRGTQAEH
jgi:hypothetical protein